MRSQTIRHGRHCAFELTHSSRLPVGFWWNLATFSTVGFGDIYPLTFGGKMLTVATMFIGIFFIAMPLSIIGGSFVEAWDSLQSKILVEESRALQEHEEWKLETDMLISLQRQSEMHISRLEKHTADCIELAPAGPSQFEAFAATLAELKEVTDDCWRLYPQLDLDH